MIRDPLCAKPMRQFNSGVLPASSGFLGCLPVARTHDNAACCAVRNGQRDTSEDQPAVSIWCWPSTGHCRFPTGKRMGDSLPQRGLRARTPAIAECRVAGDGVDRSGHASAESSAETTLLPLTPSSLHNGARHHLQSLSERKFGTARTIRVSRSLTSRCSSRALLLGRACRTCSRWSRLAMDAGWHSRR